MNENVKKLMIFSFNVGMLTWMTNLKNQKMKNSKRNKRTNKQTNKQKQQRNSDDQNMELSPLIIKDLKIKKLTKNKNQKLKNLKNKKLMAFLHFMLKYYLKSLST